MRRRSSDGTGLATASQIGYYAGADGGQSVGGWLWDADSLEGEELWGCGACAPGDEEFAGRIELADGTTSVIRDIEVARRIECQADWVVQVSGDIAEVNTR